jgi:hypothetical protein
VLIIVFINTITSSIVINFIAITTVITGIQIDLGLCLDILGCIHLGVDLGCQLPVCICGFVCVLPYFCLCLQIVGGLCGWVCTCVIPSIGSNINTINTDIIGVVIGIVA